MSIRGEDNSLRRMLAPLFYLAEKGMHEKMKVSENPASRAIQFAPYQSLRGYSEIVEECKIVPDQRVELSEDEIEQLSIRLTQLEKGTSVTVTYYRQNHYVTLTDTVHSVDGVFKILHLSHLSVPFEDILKI